MKRVKSSLGATVILFNERLDKVLMMKRNSNKRLAPGTWGNIGGKLEGNESTLDAAVREVWEETGFRIRKKDLRLVTYAETYVERIGRIVIFIYATRVKESMPRMSDEHSHAEWFKIHKLPKPKIDDPVEDARRVLMEKVPIRPFMIKNYWKL